MFLGIQALADAIPSPTFVEPLAGPDALSGLKGSSRELSELTRKMCDSLGGVRRAADAVFEEAVREKATSEQLRDWVDQVRQIRLAKSETIYAAMHNLQQISVDTKLEAFREYVEQFTKAMAVTLALLDNLITRLQTLAAGPKGDGNHTLGGHAVQDSIDHAAVTQEIIARYPKILAALAK